MASRPSLSRAAQDTLSHRGDSSEPRNLRSTDQRIRGARAHRRRDGNISQIVYRLTVPVIALLAVVGYATTHLLSLSPSHEPPVPVVRSDGTGYYSYLPAYLVQRDPTFRTWVAHDLQKQPPGGFHFVASTNRYLQQYPVGEAVMILPFFAVGHVVAVVSGANADGYSPIETGTAGLAGLTYMVFGLAILGRSLRRYFSPLVTSAVLLSITFGTDLFNYGTFESIFSHAFSFFLLAALIELLHRWQERPERWPLAVGIGVVMGLTCDVRPNNILFLVLIPLFGVSSREKLRERIALFWEHRGHVVAMLAVAVLTFAPQSLIWHEATGKWLINSYGMTAGSFDFTKPQLSSVLFSFLPHGLIPWAPILVLAVIGLVPMRRRVRPLLLATVVIMLVQTYLIASWNFWWMGGGYGNRGFIDIFPLLAFALGSLYAFVSASWPSRVVVGVPALVCCGVVVIQMINYWEGRLSLAGADFHQYMALLHHAVF